MARKSRKATAQSIVQVEDTRIRVALYLRLSVDGGRRDNMPLESQKMILEHYLESHPEMFLYDTYIDNGAAGTNFRRPGFQQMLSDIEAGHINCVIVKDLSRLGRNTIDTGYYIEQYFPQHKVRFIAITDQYDSANPDDFHAGIMLALKNMVNEAYALDIGRKIKAQQRQAMKDGEYVGARPPYGYLKAPDNCHKLIVDPTTAPVVRQIFEWAAEGAGLNTIAVRLNEAGVLSPSFYKKSIGEIRHENLMGSGHWQTRTVNKILRSEIYTGDMVQGHSKTVAHRQIRAGADNLITVPNTHEAIISHELFDSVQCILDSTAEKAKKRVVESYSPNLLKGKIFCAHCGRPLHRQRSRRKRSDDVYIFHCLTPSRVSHDKKICEGVSIREDRLLTVIMDTMKREMGAAVEVASRSQASAEDKKQQQALLAQKKDHAAEVQRLRSRIRRLYEDLVQGVLDKEDYFQFKAQFEQQIVVQEEHIAAADRAIENLEQEAKRRKRLCKAADALAQKPELTQDLIDRFVERVEVTPEKEVRVRFYFQQKEE